ncbi:MAG: serine/threonine-protein kinase [Phycisphaerae bacterium]
MPGGGDADAFGTARYEDQPVTGSSGFDAPSDLARQQRVRDLVASARSAAKLARSRQLPHAPLSADAIPGYELLREVHRGGQGVVYQALQRSTGRTVALKVMREGPFTTESGRLRFEREVTILAALNHRHIVGILDRGTHAGSGYLTMDFVAGQPLDRFARERSLSLDDRLRLFASICDAVTAAHRKGVIHRDLKPSNILIDAAGEPHILDFGLAKWADGGPDGQPDAPTQTGQFIGSLPWTSPEQALGRQAEVDTRSDVYSLGVILYYLVAGQFPYSTAGELTQVLANITTTQPIRPRSIDPAVDFDLETITLKCLSKEPARRYQSVDELARDLRHFLNREPIDARRDSAWYLLRTTLRRHRVALGVACGFVLLVAASSVVAWILLVRARDAASAARYAETVAQSLATEARTQARRAQRINEFVKTAMKSANPNEGGDQGMLVADAMMQALHSIEAGTIDDDPETKAGLLATISTILNCNGRSTEAAGLATRALEIQQQLHRGDHVEVARALNDLAVVLQDLGRHEEALSLYRQSLDMHRRLHAGDDPDVASGLNNLASALDAVGRPDQAEPLFAEALEMSRRLHSGDDAGVAHALNNLGFVRFHLGRRDEAKKLFQQALEMRRRLFVGDHPDTASSLGNLAMAAGAVDGPAAAEPLHLQALKMQQRLFKGDHAIIASTLSNLAMARNALGRHAEAEELYSRALAMRRRLFPGDHPQVALSLGNLAAVKQALKKPADAVTLREEAVAMLRRLHHGDHPMLAVGLTRLAECQGQLHRYADALAPAKEAADMAARILPEKNATRKLCDKVLADTQAATKRAKDGSE